MCREWIVKIAPFVLVFAALLIVISPLQAEVPHLSMPLDCSPLTTCFIQNYVDVDPTTAVHDYTCNEASYDGHKGVDFRISSIAEMMAGVPVLAAAPGKILAVRDNMRDRLISSEKDVVDVQNRECGNGLIISHGDGWETQYCHMRQGSLKVQPGDSVKRGQVLGLIGLSGNTTFPHIHLAVRHNGKVVDPFTGATPQKEICGTAGNPLWDAAVINDFPYESGQLVVVGFANQPVSESMLMEKGKMVVPRSRKAKALVFYGMALNLEKGDRLRIIMTGPEGELVNRTRKPFNRHKASFMTFAGKKRRTTSWPAGKYKGSFSLLRGDQVVWKKQESLTLK